MLVVDPCFRGVERPQGEGEDREAGGVQLQGPERFNPPAQGCRTEQEGRSRVSVVQGIPAESSNYSHNPTPCKVGSPALSCVDYLGRTPLHYAALVGDGDHGLYDWLVEEGADTAATDQVETVIAVPGTDRSIQEGRTAQECFEEPRATNKNPDNLMEVPDAPR